MILNQPSKLHYLTHAHPYTQTANKIWPKSPASTLKTSDVYIPYEEKNSFTATKKQAIQWELIISYHGIAINHGHINSGLGIQFGGVGYTC